MSRGQNPLVLMMALSLPGAADALGLGEMHVNSALNEPLAADIEIVGATAEELSSLTASVANRDTFLRFGVERPAFLASATFKVSRDVNGRPVLAISSKDSFTEPVVNLLVDLRWHKGEVIRQYSLLLDPAGFLGATQMAAAARLPPVAPAPLAQPVPAVAPADASAVAVSDAPAVAVDHASAAAAVPIASADATASPAANTTRTTTHVKIGAKATLRGVAWRVGARSDSDINKTMLAIFRANPHAFEGNINRLRRGAVLTIPAAADISAISTEDAGREVHAQMTAWRASPQKVQAAQKVQTAAAPRAATPLAAPRDATAAPAPRPATQEGGDASEAAALNLRVQSLEQGIHDIQGQLKREHDRLLGVQAQVRYAEQAVNDPVPAAAAPRPWLLTFLIGGLALMAGALGAVFLKLRRAGAPQTGTNSIMAGSVPTAEETSNPDAKAGEHVPAASNTEAAPREPVFTVNEDELRAAYEDTLDISGETAILTAEIPAASGDTANLHAATTIKLQALQTAAVAHDEQSAADEMTHESADADESANADEAATVMIGTEELHVDTTKLDYNLVDLDLTAQHVHMPSVLHDRAVFKERRTNLVDVLKKAVEREPDRRDLRMKLLETYYAAAATNREAFLEVVQKLARDPERLGEGEWDRIALMGKHIAADTGLFSAETADTADSADDDKLADCA